MVVSSETAPERHGEWKGRYVRAGAWCAPREHRCVDAAEFEDCAEVVQGRVDVTEGPIY